jgi:hypothetical protein
MTPLFVLGPSGVGKSAFGAFLKERHAWLHLEVDSYPHGSGTDLHGLDAEWGQFQNQRNPAPLKTALDRRGQQARAEGVVATFPSTVLLSHQAAADLRRAGIEVAYLYATAGDCIAGFLAREKSSGRNLGVDHWVRHNGSHYLAMSTPEFAPFRVAAFGADGSRRPWQDVHDQLLRRAKS